MTRKPNWASGAYYSRDIVEPEGPTKFELQVIKLGLEGQSEVWPYSRSLRAWARRNHKHRYIPEWLLREWGLDPENTHDAGVGRMRTDLAGVLA